MGEARAPLRPGNTNRNIMIITGVVVVFSMLGLLLFTRSCGLADKNAGYMAIYSNLDLKDAANVVTVLKALKIPYQIRDEGKTIAVPKDKADDARLGLAEKNLPTGGSVGWEIFDQSKLGTTDFDRRVQFVRAISGELARTIMRVDAVQDARVQIVVPKTELFEVAKAPVTASVLLQLRPGRQLSREQVNGIVYLVASSVENLRPENVIIVDIYGNILSGPGVASIEANVIASPIPPQMYITPTREALEISPKKEEGIILKPTTAETANVSSEETTSSETETIMLPPRKITPEEKALIRLKAKEEFENMLSSKAQKMVNSFYPPNSILIKVNVETEEYRQNGKRAAVKKIKPDKKGMQKAENYKRPEMQKALTVDNIKKMTVVVLVDNRFNLTRQLKKNTYESIANALSYHPSRGDRIIMRQVPFYYPTPSQVPAEKKRGWAGRLVSVISRPPAIYMLMVAVLAVLLFALFRSVSKRRQENQAPAAVPAESEAPGPKSSAIEQMRAAVSQSPERVAELIKKWLSEENR